MGITNYIYNDIDGIIAKGKTEELFLGLGVFQQALSITNQKMNELKEGVTVVNRGKVFQPPRCRECEGF